VKTTDLPQGTDRTLYHIMMHRVHLDMCGVRVVLSNATFNNILVKSWQSDLLVEETGIPG
jgi:hypothetical protein